MRKDKLRDCRGKDGEGREGGRDVHIEVEESKKRKRDD
jgi:hypothetical protein